MAKQNLMVPRLAYEMHHGRVVRCDARRPASVAAMFDDAVRRAPDAEALVDGPMRLTYVGLAHLVERCARRFAAHGVGAGNRVALLLDNRADFVVAILAAARLGAISVPMNIRQRAPETEFALNNCGAGLLLAERFMTAQLPAPAATPQLRHTLLLDDEHSVWDGEDGVAYAERTVDEDDAFCILFTSGTTGKPKGAVMTHFNTVMSCVGTRDVLGLREAESTIVAVPLSHVTGLILGLLLMVLVGGRSVLQRGFKARIFLRLAEQERITYMIMVPAMYNLCLLEDYATYDLRAWRVGAYGGAPMPEASITALARKSPTLALANIYGATETSSAAITMPPHEVADRPGQVGRAVPYCDLLLMDENDREVPTGEPGEIWISGPTVIPYYWENAAATASAFVGGFWKSGDIGMVDEAGFVRLCDRKKDMINRGGFKIYSIEVENALMAHPAILEAAAIGKPCPVLGERVVAFAVASGQTNQDALRAFCAESLSDYKVPDSIFIVQGPLPRNANGKLLKTELRALLTELEALA